MFSTCLNSQTLRLFFPLVGRMFYCKLKNCVNWIKTSPLFCFKDRVTKGFLASHISKRRFWFHTPRSTRQHHPHIMGYFIPRPRTISWRKKWTSISHEGSTRNLPLSLATFKKRINAWDEIFGLESAQYFAKKTSNLPNDYFQLRQYLSKTI